ncbi:tRNA (adenosine(37)-N6)-threonylcarbamoyltransferase complex transferase subunit TsaD [Thermosediminibacter oceani]|uniref:tRNA N6-adenosine threonylcarbamoyltransferase n=1 Tax=Thermosediminibacter oceani (strain ATCC BAA-1034 / DSM 16646 / JW/IW-1228P) TaxID=555079 RepID=D9RZ66_THEOJ|nr:tRNA (adenosine(37)-N6)-threonylcarbamoyltransferase complex transferase subunit TsaD [Thermosediminibacter oceani]ADL08620.1 O-sialoglycoprotein endopeptidase [Thermosediminibacter oceani DSM 16646]
MKDGSFITLGIETSCDETSAAVVTDGRNILSNIILSQTEWHERFGGVVPEIASRKHLESICAVVEKALLEAGVGFKDVDLVAVTNGPGLIGALLVGVSYAKAVAYAIKKPLIGVNHIEGHIYANFLENDFEPPFVCLVVSGGHTHLIHMRDHGLYEVLGRTLDDAAGEAFDKIARALGLGYPGGPLIDKIAKSGDENAIAFPVAHIKDGALDFSFSGLKSAVLNFLNNSRQRGVQVKVEDVAASFQKAVVTALVENTLEAAKRVNSKVIALAGGVAANSRLRGELLNRTGGDLEVRFPPVKLCTDNAAMIACAGYYRYKQGFSSDLFLDAYANLRLF